MVITTTPMSRRTPLSARSENVVLTPAGTASYKKTAARSDPCRSSAA